MLNVDLLIAAAVSFALRGMQSFLSLLRQAVDIRRGLLLLPGQRAKLLRTGDSTPWYGMAAQNLMHVLGQDELH